MLHTRLEEHSCGQCEDIAGAARCAALVVHTIVLVQRGTAEVHGTNGITDEGMDAGIEGLSIAGTLSEVQILGSENGLRGYVVRIHPLPTSRQCTAMENALDAIVVGIGEDIFVELHHLLLVATEEVDLDSQNAVLLHPSHLLAACTTLVHLVAWALRGIVPRTVGIVPEEQPYTLAAGITRQFLHLLITYLCVPKRIDQQGAVTHSCGKVHIAFLLIEVAAGIHADNP